MVHLPFLFFKITNISEAYQCHLNLNLGHVHNVVEGYQQNTDTGSHMLSLLYTVLFSVLSNDYLEKLQAVAKFLTIMLFIFLLNHLNVLFMSPVFSHSLRQFVSSKGKNILLQS